MLGLVFQKEKKIHKLNLPQDNHQKNHEPQSLRLQVIESVKESRKGLVSSNSAGRTYVSLVVTLKRYLKDSKFIDEKA